MDNIKEKDKVKLALGEIQAPHPQDGSSCQTSPTPARLQKYLKMLAAQQTLADHPHCHCLPATPSAAPEASCQLTPEAAPLLLMAGTPKRPTVLLLPAAAAASELLPAPNLVLVSAPNSGCADLPGPDPAWPAGLETTSALMLQWQAGHLMTPRNLQGAGQLPVLS